MGKLFQKEKKMIDKLLNQVVYEFAKEAVERTISVSPVWSGEYVHSMNLTTGPAAPEHTRYNRPFDRNKPRVDQAAARASALTQATSQAEALKQSKAKTIHLTNAAPHALIVEGMHAPFAQAEGLLKGIQQAIIKRAEAKVKI